MNAILEQVNSASLWFVEFALPMLVQSSVLILILLLADFALRKKVRAVFRYWIWLLVLLKLVLPTSLSAPLSLGYFFGDQLAYVDIAQTTTEPAQTAPAIVTPMINPPPIEAGSDTSAIAPTTPIIESVVAKPVNTQVVSVTPLSWQGAVFLAWLTVVLTMGLLLLQRAIFVRGLVAQAKETNSFMANTLESCCERMGVKRKLGLKVSANATSPAVCGLFRPVILLPQNLTSSLSSSQLRAVLLHELAHIRRGDLWVNLAQTILQIIYFYNPLLWLANCIIRRVREQAVDEMVLVAMGEKAQQYPQTLVNVAKLAFKRPALSLRLIGVVESKSALAGRIKHILNRPMPKRAKLGILGLAVVIITAAILLPMAKSMPGPPGLIIKGMVKDAQTGEPIAGARVFDDGYGPKPNWEQIKADERFEWGAITNSAGEYSFLTWPEHHSIKVEAPGYRAKRQSLYSGHFTLNKKDEEVMDFAIEPEEVPESSGFKKTLPMAKAQKSEKTDVQVEVGKADDKAQIENAIRQLWAAIEANDIEKVAKLGPQGTFAYDNFDITNWVLKQAEEKKHILTERSRDLAEPDDIWIRGDEAIALKKMTRFYQDAHVYFFVRLPDSWTLYTMDRRLSTLSVSQDYLFRAWPRTSLDNKVWNEYLQAADLLHKGANRAELARRFSSIGRRYAVTRQGRLCAELGILLARMVEKDKSFIEPVDLQSFPTDEQINYYIFKLRDIAEQEATVPGKCRVLFYPKTPNSPAVALRNMGRAVIPAMISLLDDRRPTRSVGVSENGGVVLRYCDVVLEIIEAISGQKFDKRTERGAFLSTADETTRSGIISCAREWWHQQPDVQVEVGSNAPISEASKENKNPQEPNEPTYRGRSLTELIAALSDQDFQTRIKAVYHLGYMGPKAKPAVPALVDALDEERLRESVLRSLGNIGVDAEEAIPALIKAIAEYAPACRWMAAESLAKIGKAAVPALKEAARSEDIYLQIWCNAALAKQEGTDSPSLRYLAQLMKNADKRTAGEAVSALTMLGPISKPLVPDLIEALKHSVVPKKHIASALARIGKDARPAVPELTKMLQDADLGTRADAISALSRIGGPDIAPAVPLLIQALKTNDTSNTVMASRVRYTAATALGSVGPDARAAIPDLVIALGDKHEFVRANSAKAIGDIDPTDLQAVPALLEAMKDESGRVRVAAAQTLLKIGPVNKKVILAFIEAANDNWKGVITACETFFSFLGPQHSYIIPDLIGMLKTPNERAQQLAIRALGNMGESAAPAMPYIIESMKNSRLEAFASGVLRKLGPKAKAAVPELIKMLGDKRKRFSAASVLEAIGPQAREAIPALQDCLGDKSRVTFARALLAINPKSEKAIQQLVRVAESAYVTGQWSQQPDAHYLLVKYGHEGNRHLQSLIDALENPNSRIRLSAAAYLGNLGAKANEAAESLGRALKDDDPEVRAMAARAILLISLKPSERKEACNTIAALLGGKDFTSHRNFYMAQVRAAGALASFGPLEEWTVPLLITEVQDGSIRTRVAAIKAFGNIGPGAKEAIPYLKRLLKNEDWQIRHSAAQAIEKIDNKTNVHVEIEPEKPAGQVQDEGGAPKQLSSGGGYQNLSREQRERLERLRANRQSLSYKNMQKLGLAVAVFANDHKGGCPSNLSDLRKYIADEKIFDWINRNVVYLGKNKQYGDPPDAVLAYDESMLKKPRQETNVLYNDAHVSFEKSEWLELKATSHQPGQNPAVQLED